MVSQLEYRQSINWAGRGCCSGELALAPSRLCQLTSDLFTHCIHFLSPEERAFSSLVNWSFNRIVTKVNVKILTQYASIIEPIVHFCIFLESKIEEAFSQNKVRLLRNFKACDSLTDVEQRIYQIKKHMVIDLSKLENDQIVVLGGLCFPAPDGFIDVFRLAMDRKAAFTSIRENPASLVLSTIESLAPFLKDDEAIVYAFIERYKGLWSSAYVWKLTNERLRNKESLVLAVMRKCPRARGITMQQYVSQELKNNARFMKEAKKLMHVDPQERRYSMLQRG